ncbi:hypothetical protein Dimus_025699 [Dionaea muscipula]
MNPFYRTLARSSKRIVAQHLLSPLSFSTRTSRLPSSSSVRSTPKVLPPAPPPLQPPPELCSNKPPAEDVETKKVEMVFNRPRPSEIPFQTKVANTVNLIGTVQSPIQFRSSPDGKCWAGTLISHQQFSDSPPLRLPIVFEGDLAHTAACHLKEKDDIYIAGELSADPLPIALDTELAHLQVVVHSINFVHGVPELKKSHQGLKEAKSSDNAGVAPEADACPQGNDSDSEKKTTESPRHSWHYWGELVKNPKEWCDHRNEKLSGVVNPKYPDFKKVDGGIPLWLQSAPKWIVPKLEGLEFSTPAPKQKKGGGEFRTSFFKKKEVGSKVPLKKGNESWKDLLDNPNKWWDNRSAKMSAKSPDFKHKDTGEGLWLNSAPEWVLLKLPKSKSKGSFGDKETLLS